MTRRKRSFSPLDKNKGGGVVARAAQTIQTAASSSSTDRHDQPRKGERGQRKRAPSHPARLSPLSPFLRRLGVGDRAGRLSCFCRRSAPRGRDRGEALVLAVGILVSWYLGPSWPSWLNLASSSAREKVKLEPAKLPRGSSLVTTVVLFLVSGVCVTTAALGRIGGWIVCGCRGRGGSGWQMMG